MTITPASGAQVTRMVAARARVGDGTMQSFEDRHRPANHKIVAIQRALEAAGVEFIDGEPGAKLTAKAR
jgi:hypothetical protein